MFSYPFLTWKSWTGSHTSRLSSLRLHVGNAVPFLQELSSLQHVLLPFVFTSFLPSLNWLSPLNWRVSTFPSAFTSTLAFLHLLCSATPCLWLGGSSRLCGALFRATGGNPWAAPIPPHQLFCCLTSQLSSFPEQRMKNKVTNHFLDLGVYTWIPLWSWHLPFSFNLIHSSSLYHFRSEIKYAAYNASFLCFLLLPASLLSEFEVPVLSFNVWISFFLIPLLALKFWGVLSPLCLCDVLHRHCSPLWT